MAKRIPYNSDYRTEDIGDVTLEYVSALFGAVEHVTLDTGAVVLWSREAQPWNKRASTLVSLAADGVDADGQLRNVYGEALWLGRNEYYNFLEGNEE